MNQVQYVAQPGILANETHFARYLSFQLTNQAHIKTCLLSLQEMADGEAIVVGIGLSMAKALDCQIEGLEQMNADSVAMIDVPSTPAALWIWLRGDDRGELFHRSRQLEIMLELAFELTDVSDSFQYDSTRDLSGYIDGTENPTGEEAVNIAMATDKNEGIEGSSFVVVQQWLHDFDTLDAMTEVEKDDSIGRHIKDNEEFDSAPESAHVKRAAQESFEPEAFLLRRSMPWVDGMSGGLMFVAFAKSFSAFEAILSRMLGKEDAIQDGLFNFTKPVSGAYYWCPPMKKGKLNLKQLGL